MPTENELKALILHKLRRGRCWGGKYRPIQKVIRYIPPHLRGKAKDLIDEMIKEGFLESHKRKKCVSLNIRYKEEIIRFIRKYRIYI